MGVIGELSETDVVPAGGAGAYVTATAAATATATADAVAAAVAATAGACDYYQGHSFGAEVIDDKDWSL
jgi:hypothetical protein